MKYLIILLFVGIGFSQTGVFTSNIDTATITDATETQGQWIELNPPYEGIGSLFVAGDSLSGTTGDVTVTYELYYGKSNGDDLISEEFTLGTVAAAQQKNTYGSGTLVGETFDVGADSEWKDALEVRFSFTGTGTQSTLIISVFKIGK